jgi:ABC-type multidrug transport system ATPase subunit
MRRVGLAVELVTRPTTLFLDEVTSGLDSYNAAIVMEVCRKLTRSTTDDGRRAASVLMSIHQPSSRLFDMMDSIILLMKGRVLYQGPSGELVLQYFEQRGYPLPVNYNPAVSDDGSAELVSS